MKFLKSLLTSSLFYHLVAILVVIFIYLSTSNLSSQSSADHSNTLEQGLYDCKLIAIIDGDSIEADCQQQLVSIRILGIDAPELGQTPWGQRSKDYLASLLPTSLQLKISGKDRYQRYLANILVDGRDIAIDLLDGGYAVVYNQYKPPAHYRQAMHSAKRQQLGIWSTEGLQQNPQLYRRLAL